MSTVDLSKKTVNLSKGDKINLSKSAEGLANIMVGLGWDPADNSVIEQVTEVIKPGFLGKLFGATERTVTRNVVRHSGNADTIDCDAWLALLQGGKLVSDDDIIYYGRKEFYNKDSRVVHHHGDNLTGEGEGDDEQITISLKKLPEKYDSIVIGVTIYRGAEKRQSFGSIKNTFIRVVDERDGFEICRFDQSEVAENKDAITFIAGKLYKDKGEWQFTAIGKGTKDKSISEAASHYKYK